MQRQISAILENYRLTHDDVTAAAITLLRAAHSRNINIVLANLFDAVTASGIVQSATSDGKTIFLHEDADAIGGEAARCFDLIHVAFGHYYQWSAGDDANLVFRGDSAWELATANFFGASESLLQQAYKYEYEAHQVSLANLEFYLTSATHPKNSCLTQFFRDWMATDLLFLNDYYRGAERLKLFDRWIYGASLPPKIFTGSLAPAVRTAVCFPLVRPGIAA